MSPMSEPHATGILTNYLHLNMNRISVTKADMFNSLLHRRTRTQVEMSHSAKGNPTHKWETILTKASWANVVTQLKTVPTKKKSQIHKDSSSLMISSPSTYTGPTRQACWQTACIQTWITFRWQKPTCLIRSCTKQHVLRSRLIVLQDQPNTQVRNDSHKSLMSKYRDPIRDRAYKKKSSQIHKDSSSSLMTSSPSTYVGATDEWLVN